MIGDFERWHSSQPNLSTEVGSSTVEVVAVTDLGLFSRSSIFRLPFARSIPHKSSFSQDAFFAADVTVLFRFIELLVPSLLLFCRRLL